MSKKSEAQSEPKQPAYVEALLNNGTVIFEAKTREELAKMFADIPAGIRYSAGAVTRNKETGIFALRLDIIND